MKTRRRINRGRTIKKPKPQECNYKKGWWRNNWITLVLGIFAIGLSFYFANQARISSERIEKVTDASLYMGIKGFTDRMGMDISKIEDPLFFFDVYMADLKGDKKLIKESLFNYIEYDSTKGMPYWLLGKYYSDDDDLIPDNPDSAIQLYAKAILNMDDNDPNKHIAFNNRGIVKLDKKDNSGAIVDFDSAVKLNPKYAMAFNNRGIAKLNLEDYEGAIADYEKAIELKPDLVEAKQNLAIAKKKLAESTNPSGGEEPSGE